MEKSLEEMDREMTDLMIELYSDLFEVSALASFVLLILVCRNPLIQSVCISLIATGVGFICSFLVGAWCGVLVFGEGFLGIFQDRHFGVVSFLTMFYIASSVIISLILALYYANFDIRRLKSTEESK